MSNAAGISPEDLELFKELVNENRYDFVKLAFIIFPFGQKGHDLEFKRPYAWQIEEWARLSKHLSDPATRYEAYRLAVSSGNGAAKTAFGAMTFFMLAYTQQLKGRITANTQIQMRSIIWPEYDKWFRYARFAEHWFEKLGESIKALDPDKAENWRLDVVTWDENRPASISGLHNEGKAILYTFEEAPGIPAVIWNYASGSMTDVDTIKVWLAFGNSDDPESKFEQNMQSPGWASRRIDTRTLAHVDKKQIAIWLQECGGNEDHDEFRVRVRGLPRKSAKDSVIAQEAVIAALRRSLNFDITTVRHLPVILMCDPAWKGGDFTTIWYRQGHYARILEKYQLIGDQDHMRTYSKLCEWERDLMADAVFIDQGEGTALKTLANNAGKAWELVAFGSSPNDTLEVKDSQYGNLRAQMYYESNKWLLEGAVLDARLPEWRDDIEKQLPWTKGTRHKVTGKKMCESKLDLKARVGLSPDVADGFVLGFARPVLERLPDHGTDPFGNRLIGSGAFKMPAHEPSYETEAEYRDLYD